ncbi:hypothetical protein ACFQL7_20855 [Halocatena marina]|uniref:Uncharacterized protein n=1 Tax=Halocatena marina TaxID=2934937 RepID=A0ABD5YVH1_9EURY|nr:hypothetical protein [Halocatena marina]
MVSIGGTALPGVKTTVESANNAAVNVGAPAQVGLVGQGDLTTGTATAGEVYEIRTPSQARSEFGTGTLLAEAAVDALTEGAYPVYCAPAGETSVSAEDIGTSATGTLANAPVTEDVEDMSVTVDSSSKTPVVTYKDPTTQTPGTDEFLYNPVTGAYALSTAPSTSATVDYVHYDYQVAVDAIINEEGERIDFLGSVNENDNVVSMIHDAALQQIQFYNFMIAVAGFAPYIADTSTITAEYDSSRIQQLYPTRNADGESIIGSYLGLRGRIGIDNSPIFKRLKTQNDLIQTLSKGSQTDLVNEQIVPVADEARGSRIVEDLTCVADDNAGESSMRQALHRLIVDYVTEIVNEASERFIGELHTQSARNALRSIIVSELQQLRNTNAITAFTVTVEKVDAMTASVDCGIDTIDPLRNILATITAGQIENPDQQVSSAAA